MTPVELASSATLIARARVIDTDESDYSDFRQIAELELIDVIEGDFTIGEVRVAAQSLVAFTNDPARGVDVDVNGAGGPTIIGADFAHALLANWVGSETPNQSLRAGMLGGPCD